MAEEDKVPTDEEAVASVDPQVPEICADGILSVSTATSSSIPTTTSTPTPATTSTSTSTSTTMAATMASSSPDSQPSPEPQVFEVANGCNGAEKYNLSDKGAYKYPVQDKVSVRRYFWLHTNNLLPAKKTFKFNRYYRVTPTDEAGPSETFEDPYYFTATEGYGFDVKDIPLSGVRESYGNYHF